MEATKNIKVAIMFSAIGQYATQILGFVTIMVIARLLTPEEIGVYAVAGTVMLIASQLRTLGVVQYLIREKEISENKIRAVLGMTIIVSWGLGFILILSAPYLADFYNEPAIKKILLILSITFFVGPFSSVPVALWLRNMQFKQIFIMRITGEIVMSVCSISLVLLGFSYYGLATSAAIGLTSELLVIILLSPPGTVWQPRFNLVKDLIMFGFFTSLTQLFIRFSEGIPDLVIGKVGMMADVGQFSRGFGAVLFLNRILTAAIAPVVLPHLSEVKRSGGSVADAYLRAVKLLLAFTWPVLAVASAASYPMINALFGDQWGSAVSVSSILAVWVMFTSIHSFSSSALIASGAEKLMFVTVMIVNIFRLFLVVFAVSHGLDAVAWAMVVSGVLEFSVNTWALKKSIGLMINKMVFILLPNFFLALACWLVTKAIDQVVPFEEANPFHSIGIIALCLPIIWLLMLRLIKHEAWYLMWEIINNKIIIPFKA